MSVYYSDDLVTLYHGDCREVLPTIQGVAATFTSPPYNTLGATLGKASGMYAKNSWRAKVASAGYADDMPEKLYAEWQATVASAIADASLPNASLFYNHKCRWRDGVMFHPIDYVRSWPEWSLRQEVIWDRNRSMTFNARLFPVADERIFWMVRGEYVWNQEATRYLSVWKVRPQENEPDHPCPFPIGIVAPAIVATTKPSDVVLDPFAGTGTTLFAAKQLGRKAIGVELEERYCEIAARRLAQDTLFGASA